MGSLPGDGFQSRLPGVGGSARREKRKGPRGRLSIPFAESWGLRLKVRNITRDFCDFQSRLPGVGGSADSEGTSSNLALPTFNPVCRELGAPPSEMPAGASDLTCFQSRLPGVGGSAESDLRLVSPFWSFNPVCRELGAPPRARLARADLAAFQSRLPGVGGSARAGRALRSGRPAPFNPVCRELGAPPQNPKQRKTIMAAFNPVCRELGAPPGLSRVQESAELLSIPFAGSWGLRLIVGNWGGGIVTFNPVCRELGAPPKASWKHAKSLRLSIPFAGSWGLRPNRQRQKKVQYDLPFNPVCRELGAPPCHHPQDHRQHRPAFNPVCRELGAPPRLQDITGGLIRSFQSRLPGVGGSAQAVKEAALERDGCFQSRLPGVGGSALTAWRAESDLRFQSRLPGVGGSAWREMLRERARGLAFQSRLPGVGGSALWSCYVSYDVSHLSIPFAGSWGLRLRTGACLTTTVTFFQSRLPGVGGSAVES